MSLLYIERGPDKGKEMILSGGCRSLICGRASDADFRLTDPLVSSRHFRLTVEGENATIEDLQSTNGLYVNNEKVILSHIKPGDIIRAGDTFIAFINEEEKTSTGVRPAVPELAGFELLERISVGGMGAVYKARQKSLDRIVALKILSAHLTANEAFVERFRAEARTAGRLIHPHIVQVHDMGMEAGTYYICLEYMGGGSLTDLLRQEGKIPLAKALAILRDVARGLDYAEQHGIVHCDIKPDNILLTEDGQAKIADLGISRRLVEQSEERERPEAVLGSPHYMAPEQAQGKAVDQRTDLYALGCTAFRMLAGRTLFTGNHSAEIMEKQVFAPPPDLLAFAPEAGERVAKVVAKLLQKNPAERYQHARELLHDLQEIDKDLAVAARPSSAVSTAPKPRTGEEGEPAPASVTTSVAVFRVRRRSRATSTTAIFVPAAIVAVAIGIAVYLGLLKIQPDPAAAALREAQQLAAAGEYEAALARLRGQRARDVEVGREIVRLQSELSIKIREREAERNFQRLWQDYLDFKQQGASAEDIKKRLEELHKQFSGIRPEWAAIIQSEKDRLR